MDHTTFFTYNTASCIQVLDTRYMHFLCFLCVFFSHWALYCTYRTFKPEQLALSLIVYCCGEAIFNAQENWWTMFHHPNKVWFSEISIGFAYHVPKLFPWRINVRVISFPGHQVFTVHHILFDSPGDSAVPCPPFWNRVPSLQKGFRCCSTVS